MVLDCLDSGLANVDMEYINILLGTLKTYYPETLHYILIYEMPWIMNGEWGKLTSTLTFQHNTFYSYHPVVSHLHTNAFSFLFSRPISSDVSNH